MCYFEFQFDQGDFIYIVLGFYGCDAWSILQNFALIELFQVEKKLVETAGFSAVQMKPFFMVPVSDQPVNI